MPRRPRLHLDGVPLHVVQRGHNRQPCFFAEEDYHAYLHCLGEALKREGRKELKGPGSIFPFSRDREILDLKSASRTSVSLVLAGSR